MASSSSEPRLALITGGGRGIGAATALRLARDGYRIALVYQSDRGAAERVVGAIAENGGTAMAFAADVGDDEAVTSAFARADALGELAVLVNNAGITGGFARVDELETKVLARVLAVNVLGAFVCAREAVRRMSTRYGGSGGSIINVGSRASVIGSGGEYVHYAASKGALDTFTLGLAREVATEGIRVNAVSPGLVDTEIHATSGDPERPARIAPTIPMQRIGTPEEVAETIAWLASPAASYVTGAIVPVSGGR